MTLIKNIITISTRLQLSKLNILTMLQLCKLNILTMLQIVIEHLASGLVTRGTFIKCQVNE
jgi:hypothetical protein